MTMIGERSLISVSVLLARPQCQQRVTLQVWSETSVRTVLRMAIDAGLDLAGSDLAVDSVSLAVYGEHIDDGYRLADGDRLELLRPLRQAPTELRRQRAGKRGGRRET